MTAAERAREISGPCAWAASSPCGDLADHLCCTECAIYRRAFTILLAHEAEVRDEIATYARRYAKGGLCLGDMEADNLAHAILFIWRKAEEP